MSRTVQLNMVKMYVLYFVTFQFSSVQSLIVSESLQPQGLQDSRLPCPSPTPGADSNSCPSRWWCHPTISSSVIPFSSCLQSFPASGFFLMSQLFTSGGEDSLKILKLDHHLTQQSHYWAYTLRNHNSKRHIYANVLLLPRRPHLVVLGLPGMKF